MGCGGLAAVDVHRFDCRARGQGLAEQLGAFDDEASLLPPRAPAGDEPAEALRCLAAQREGVQES